jgi:RNA polymerase sigma factor (sigma-70 family)
VTDDDQALRPPPPDVVEAFRRGERASFFAVYETYGAEVRALVGRFFRSSFEREEAVQEIWLNVHQAAAQYDPSRGPLLPWLRTVATNRCLQLLRAQGRRPAASQPVRDDDLIESETPQTAARNARLRAAIEAFAAGLGPEEREVFKRAFAEGGTQEEGARSVGISVRRYKYLKKKILDKASIAPELARVLEEVRS